jgi:hypothetical protein
VAVAAACAAAPAADAGRASRVWDLEPIGAVTYAWTGDPQRGCAVEGLCGVSGSLEVIADGSSSGGGSGPPTVDVQADATVRVSDSRAGTVSVCTDPISLDLGFVIRRGTQGRLRARSVDEGFPGPSAGRCAGPTAQDLQAAVLPVRARRHRGYDLSGSSTFGAGPFKVTVASTLRAVSVRDSFPTPPPGPGNQKVPPHHTVLVENARVAYRVSSVVGSLSASFTARQGLICQQLDVCGGDGGLTVAPTAPVPPVTFYGSRVVHHSVGRHQAVADLFAGRLPVEAAPFDGALRARVTGSFGISASSPCEDVVDHQVIGVDSHGGRHALAIVLDPNPSSLFAEDDPLRTRCPGPTGAELLGRHALASGSVPLVEVGARQITLVLRASGGFADGGFAGTRGGAVTVTLTRGKATGKTRTMTIYRGEGIP